MTHPAYQLDWNLIRTFTAVVGSGSMAAAARDLGLTYPTVARHVQALEDNLQLTLFDRTSTGMTPSIAGLRLAESAADMRNHATAFDTASASIRSKPTGSVRITASELLTQITPALLAPLRDWADSNGTTVEIMPSDTTLNLLDRDADIALRHARPTQADLICRLAASLDIGLWASPSYLAPVPDAAAAAPDSLLYVDGIHARYLQRGASSLGIELREEQFVYRTDCLWSRLHAARTGWGVTLLPNYLGERYSDLTPVWPDLVIAPLEVWMVARRDMRDNPLHRRVFDHLAQSLGTQLNGVGDAMQQAATTT